MRKLLIVCLVVVFTVAVGAVALAQPYDPYAPIGFGFVTTNLDTPEIVLGSREVDNAPGDEGLYLSNLRGLPTDADDRFLAAYDLLGGGRLYSLSTTTLDALGVRCENIVVWKVNVDASIGSYANYYCEDGVLFIRNNTSTATFVLLRA
jgi:hypothetical protein